MSSINFARFRNEIPRLGAVWEGLESWVDSHTEELLDAPRLSRELYPLTGWHIVQALEAMSAAGVLSASYRVVDPSGSMLGEEFETTEEIPQMLWDAMHDYMFEVKPRHILPVFKVVDRG